MAIKKEINNFSCFKYISRLFGIDCLRNKKYDDIKRVPEIDKCIRKENDPEGLKKLKLVFSYKMF